MANNYESGPRSYRDLQKLNKLYQSGQLKFDNISDDFEPEDYGPGSFRVNEMLNARNQQVEDYDVKSPLMQNSEGSDYWGKSQWDDKILEDNQLWQSLSDRRAENQPWYSQLANGVGKGLVNTVTTALELLGNAGGMIQGIGSAIETEGDFWDKGSAWLNSVWDNPITQALKSVNDAAEEFMPNYYTQDEQENPLALKNIFTMNTLADKILKNVGFMVGAYYGGLPLAAGVGKAGQIAVKGARALARAERAGLAARAATETAANAAKGTEAVQAILEAKKLTDVARGERMSKILDNVLNVSKATRVTSEIVGSTASALSEGSIEAINNSEDWAKEARQKENTRYAERIEELKKTTPEDELEETLVNEAQEHDERLAEIEKNKAAVGNADLLMNLPILTASNMFRLGHLYARGFDSTRRSMGNFWNGYKSGVGKDLASLKSTKTTKGAILAGLKDINAEGMEEYLQRAASDAAGTAVQESIDRYFKNGKSERSKASVGDYVSQFGQAMIKNMGDQSAIEEYLIGAVSAAMGMPTFGKANNKNAWIGKNQAVGLSGGLIGSYNEYMEQKTAEDNVNSYLAGRINDPKFKTLYENLRKNNDLDALINGTLSENDKLKYKDLKFEQIFNDINAAASSGYLSEFKELVGFTKDFTDDELKDAMENTVIHKTADQLRNEDTQAVTDLEAAITDLTKERDDIIADVKRNKRKKNNDEERTVKGVKEAYNPQIKEAQEQLAAAKRRLQDDEDGSSPYQDRYEGPFHDPKTGSLLFNDDTKQEMRSILERNREELLRHIDNYVRLRNEVDYETDGLLSDDDISTLTFLRAKIEDVETRSADIAEDLAAHTPKVLKDFETRQEGLNKDVEAAQKAYDIAKEKYEAARTNPKAKEKTRDKYKLLAERAKENLDKIKKTQENYEAVHKYYSSIAEEKKNSPLEEYAYRKGYGDNRRRRIAGIFNPGTRKATDEELTAEISNDPKANILMLSILENKELSEPEKNKLIGEVRDLLILSKMKQEYNKVWRKYVGDISLLRDDTKKREAEEIEKKLNELADGYSMKIANATTMRELHNVATSPEITSEALNKAFSMAKESASEETKKRIEDYENARSLTDGVIQQLSQTPNDATVSVVSSLQSIIDTAIDNFDSGTSETGEAVAGTLTDQIKRIVDRAITRFEESGTTVGKQSAEALRNAFNSISEAKSSTDTKTSTREPSKDSSTSTTADTGTTMETGSFEELKRKAKENAAAKKAEEKPLKVPTREEAEKGILDHFAYIKSQNDTNEENKPYPSTVDELSKDKDLSDYVKAYNDSTTDPSQRITDDTVASLLNDFIQAQVTKEQEDLEEGAVNDETYDVDDVSDTERQDRMRKEVAGNYRSTWVSEYEYDSTSKKPSDTSKFTSQQKRVKEILESTKAYDFLDKNLLGYIDHRLATEGGSLLPLRFVMSTDKDVNGDGSNPVIFLALKWNDAWNDTVGEENKNNLNLKTIDGEQYQIIGVNSISKDSGVQEPWGKLQEVLGKKLKEKVDKAGEGVEFVKLDAEDDERYFPQVQTIYTGRLNKSEVGEGKQNVYSLVQGTFEWNESKKDERQNKLPIGVVVGNSVTISSGVSEDRIVKPNIKEGETGHNGKVFLFAPRPDGKYYPISCTRCSVSDWLQSEDNYKGKKGADILREALENPSSLKDNDYLKTILDNVKILADSEKSFIDKLNAKSVLSQFFIFGKDHGINLSSDGKEVTLFSKDGKNNTILNGDDVKENVDIFFNTLAKNNIRFTVPSPTKKIGQNISPLSIISAGVLTTGLKDFYNYNADFIIKPIDAEGNLVTGISATPKDDVMVHSSVPAQKQMEINFTLDGKAYQFKIEDTGDELKVYKITTKGTESEVQLMSSDEDVDLQNLASIIYGIQRGEYENETIPNKFFARYYDLKNTVEAYMGKGSPLEKYSKQYVITLPSGIYVYDAGTGNKAEPLIKVKDENEVFNKFLEDFKNSVQKDMNSGKKMSKTMTSTTVEAIPLETSTESKEDIVSVEKKNNIFNGKELKTLASPKGTSSVDLVVQSIVAQKSKPVIKNKVFPYLSEYTFTNAKDYDELYEMLQSLKRGDIKTSEFETKWNKFISDRKCKG